MNPTLQQEYNEKFKTLQEAVKVVKNGDIIYAGASTSIAYGLCEALGTRAEELEDVTIVSSQVIRPLEIMSSKYPKAFKSLTFFMGPKEREMHYNGLGDFTSVHLSQIDIFCTQTAPANVAFLEVSPPDGNGYMSLGCNGVALGVHVLEKAKTAVLQVNKHVPFVCGENHLIHISQADVITECDQKLAENPGIEFDDTIKTISGYLIDQIPDGACVQFGLGGVAAAVGYGLKNKNDLGAHSELMTDSIMELMELGVVNNSRKTYMTGKTVASFAFGSEKLYKFLDRNPDVYFMPFTEVNDPVNIAKNDNMISINTALSIDLFGQVCADNIAGRQFSATGGQLDFVRGAQMSKGGKSFIAVTSTYQDKKKGMSSRIVAQFPMGTAVTTPRSDVQYVVTEFGCVNLKPLTMKDRVRAMISLAHPDFRPQLAEDAKRAGIL